MENILDIRYDVIVSTVAQIEHDVEDFSDDLLKLTDFTNEVLSSWTGDAALYYEQVWENFYDAARDLIAALLGLTTTVQTTTTNLMYQLDDSSGNIKTSFSHITDSAGPHV